MSKEPRNRIDLRNTWQVVAGAILVPLGVVVLSLGWYGAAHSPYVQGQIPYLISGGLLGLGLMVVGALLYWAHWLYRVYDQAALHHEELMAALLGSQGAAPLRPVAGGGPPGSGSGVPDAEGEALVATLSGTNFHRPGCPLISRGKRPTRTVSPTETASMVACRICRPRG